MPVPESVGVSVVLLNLPESQRWPDTCISYTAWCLNLVINHGLDKPMCLRSIGLETKHVFVCGYEGWHGFLWVILSSAVFSLHSYIATLH